MARQVALNQSSTGGGQYPGNGGPGLALFVFHERGRPIGDFRKAWASACIAAGFSRVDKLEGPEGEEEQTVPTTIFHDLRRSAVRNFDRNNVSPSTAMKITGHKTDSVYRRYRIVPERDMRDALATTQDAVKAEAANGQQVVVPLRSATAAG